MSTAFIEICFFFLQPPFVIYLWFIGDYSHFRVHAGIPTVLSSEPFHQQCPEITSTPYSAVVLSVLTGQNIFSLLFPHADPFPPDLPTVPIIPCLVLMFKNLCHFRSHLLCSLLGLQVLVLPWASLQPPGRKKCCGFDPF